MNQGISAHPGLLGWYAFEGASPLSRAEEMATIQLLRRHARAGGHPAIN
jgi:hypothetical protein